jgi:hypothetical protein
VLSKAKLDATSHRWISALANYNFNISYRPGTFNSDADAPSRKSYLFADSVKAICNSVSLDISAAETLSQNFPLDDSLTATVMSDIDWNKEQREDLTIARVIEILEQGEKGRHETKQVQRYLRERKKPPYHQWNLVQKFIFRWRKSPTTLFARSLSRNSICRIA